MASLDTVSPSNSGAYPTLEALVDLSNTVEVGNGSNVLLLLENTNAASRSVTIVVAGTTDYGAELPDKTFTLDATTGRLMIPIRRAYSDPNVPGRATVTVDAIEGVSAVVLKVA